MSTRIIKRSVPDGECYVIQFKHKIFFWVWQDAWIRLGENVRDYFDSYEEARIRLPLFVEAKKKKDHIVHLYEENQKKDYSLDPRFWKRLKSFVDLVHVSDLPGMEEKDMIMTICKRKLGEQDI